MDLFFLRLKGQLMLQKIKIQLWSYLFDLNIDKSFRMVTP